MFLIRGYLSTDQNPGKPSREFGGLLPKIHNDNAIEEAIKWIDKRFNDTPINISQAYSINYPILKECPNKQSSFEYMRELNKDQTIDIVCIHPIIKQY